MTTAIQMVQMRTTNRAWLGETFQTPGGTYMVQPNACLIRVGQVRTPGAGTRWSPGRNQPGITPSDAAWLLDQPGGKRNWEVQAGVQLPPAPVEVKPEVTTDVKAIVAEMDAKRAHLDGRAAALDERETRLHETHEALEQRSKDLDDREAALLRRERNAGFENEPTGTAEDSTEGDNTDDDEKPPIGNLLDLPDAAPQPLADGTTGSPVEEEGEVDFFAAELAANAPEAAAPAPPKAEKPAVEFKPADPPKKKRKKAPAPPAGNKADLAVLDLSIADLTEALETGDHDGFIMALTNAETQGKTRKGALDALDNRRREVAKAAREGATT